ncbi:MAG: YkgJ family cysteine cluster protein [Deltaproteobacteria bacterium]|nr:YkgJ family cysteine cluster protein [Deltaproteobacteria bacterium]
MSSHEQPESSAPALPIPTPAPATPAQVVTPEVVRGAVLACHRMTAQATQYTFQNAVDVIALSDLLIAKGLVNSRELAERRALAERQILEVREKEYAGPTIYPTRPPQEGEERSPQILVDCDARYGECRAACCILYNVFLTAEEVRSGKYRWDLEHPYRLERTPEGHCTYLDRQTLKCTIWNDRPTVCRGYSCKSDQNIWVDFDKRIGTGACRGKQAPPR